MGRLICDFGLSHTHCLILVTIPTSTLSAYSYSQTRSLERTYSYAVLSYTERDPPANKESVEHVVREAEPQTETIEKPSRTRVHHLITDYPQTTEAKNPA
ncbi:hypothetical protein EA472_06260 [Natrarchaeobius oligotrophus]|uniref:Uncharacterized protein n=1 Tax=Natrarchaeobius chitinivorans TaxID=1679083 RepID=A0A3N6PR69_NATCH|nr:hypothetical protein EA472_06260 [Natrarchaeobius chitinivorans]